MTVDLLALWGAWYFATSTRFGAYWGADFRQHNSATFFINAAVFLFAGVLFENYDPSRGYARWAEIRTLMVGYVLASLASVLLFYFALLFYFPTSPVVGRGIFALNLAAFIVLAVIGRVIYSLIGTDFFKKRAVVVSSGGVSIPLLSELKRAAGSVYEVHGYVAPARDMSAPNTTPWLGDGSDLLELIARRQIDTVIIGSNLDTWERFMPQLILARYRGVEIVDFGRTCERFLNRIPCEHVTDLWLLWGLMGRSSFYVTRLKRLVDLVIALSLLLVALPLMAIVAIAIKLTSPGPMLYTQERIGQHDRPFKLLKFRSMVDRAEEGVGPVWAQKNDPRVTPVGRWLRRWRLDEWPQLFNVIKGDMSLVGPRPERTVFVSELEHEVPMYRQRHSLRPGITGWGQIHYNYAASREESREKLEYDLFYVKNASLLLDLTILLRTTRTLVEGHGR
jgi:exopolysaccharide biosynthesis polyprenyl glycosylphosphotransferase